MLNEIFDINTFNVYSDEENYYFFRALEPGDYEDIENNINVNEQGKLEKLRTDRERCKGKTKYSENSDISLEQITDHIKINYSKETNCISLTSNANTAITYGRGYFGDNYVVIKVPKNELGIKTYEAGLYMLNEINKEIEKLSEEDETLQYYISRIDSCKTPEQFYNIKNELREKHLLQDEEVLEENIYKQGIEFKTTETRNYNALNEKQNLEKNKVVLKVDILNKQILPRISNKLLIQTLGGAFSSLELIHYNEIDNSKIINVEKEVIDILGLLQQAPNNIEYIEEIKSILISNIGNLKTKTFELDDRNVIEEELTLDKMYEISKGKVSYSDSVDLYKKAFYLSKSKLRTKSNVEVLRQILNDPKYDQTLDYILNNGYGIEPEIITRRSNDLINISEAVSLNINKNKQDLVDYINVLDENDLQNILDNPTKTLEELLPTFLTEKDTKDRENWILDALIDSLDLDRLGIEFNLRYDQRENIKNALKEHNAIYIYNELKEKVSTKEISNVLFTNIIKNKNEIDLNDTFTLDELEWFIGYNRIEGTGLNLRWYQKAAVDNIDETYENKNFTSVILPTATGKSYVGLSEMYKFEKMMNDLENDRHAKMLYLAPNEEILNQLKDIIRETFKPEIHLNDKEDDDIKRLFPNLTLSTYQNVADRSENESNIKEIFKEQYDLIVFDELHRTGAKEWLKNIEELVSHQSNAKVLGITATPERDMDYQNMADYWAKYFGYTEEEILLNKHLSFNMDLEEAIKLGIVTCPKVVNCVYNLKSDLEDLKFSIDEIKNDELKNEKLIKYEKLRRALESSSGIEKVLNENIKRDNKYIVFLPITKKCEDEDGNAIYVDMDGNEVKRNVAALIIQDYQLLFKQYLFSDEYLTKNKFVEVLYNKIINKINLTYEERKYLELEKENILLLATFDMTYKQNNLITKNDILANTIIEYMHWEKLSKKEIFDKLNEKMKDKIDDYSMLGSYGSNFNEKILKKFNRPTDGRTKLMFVMNKLNEGVHVKDISGIVWLRPMDENSRILYLQQLGRCIKSITPGKTVTEDDIPMVIDLVNNTLKVKLDRNVSEKESDLDKILNVKSWILKNNKIPDGLSQNDVEYRMARTIVYLQEKYLKYIDAPNLLTEDNSLEKEIIKIGSEIDIWDSKIELRINEKVKNKNNDDSLIGMFDLDYITRDFIDLYDEYGEVSQKSDEAKIQWVKKIQEYCEKYKEWPKVSIDDKTVSDGTTSAQLYNWLLRSGYSKNQFKYTKIVDETGKIIKDILDELYQKYGKVNQMSDEAKIQWVKKIEEYCKKYKEWPKANIVDKTVSDGTTSAQLYQWLNIRSGYNKNQFKYAKIVDETGKLIKDILDELYQEYGETSISLDKVGLEWVKKIQEYCEKYQEWPKVSIVEQTTRDGTTSEQLYKWLIYSGYSKNQFKYINIVDKTGKSIKDILDELYQKYGIINQNSDEAKIQWIKRVQEYCEKYKEWPKKNIEDKIVSDGTTSTQLYRWIISSGYISNQFKYKNITDETGKPIKDILDELYQKYGIINQNSDEAKIQWVKKIQEYCEKYKEWPKVRVVDKIVSDGTTSDRLFIWLSHSGYNKNQFKYANIVDETGKPIKDILDELCYKYKKKKKEEYKKSKEEFDESSKFNEVLSSKENTNGRKIS